MLMYEAVRQRMAAARGDMPARGSGAGPGGIGPVEGLLATGVCRAPQFPQKAADPETSRPHCVQNGMAFSGRYLTIRYAMAVCSASRCGDGDGDGLGGLLSGLAFQAEPAKTKEDGAGDQVTPKL